jgi:antitoxin (DNA-binding transcriptional repressor) of toxin-antitoxin stability system
MLKETTITATEFKAKCLNILERLDPQGLIVTKRGRAIAKVIPLNSSDNAALIGSMKGKIRVKGDLLTTGAAWDAESGHTYRRSASRRKPKKG